MVIRYSNSDRNPIGVSHCYLIFGGDSMSYGGGYAGGGFGGTFALIVVLFILLVIVGAAYVGY